MTANAVQANNLPRPRAGSRPAHAALGALRRHWPDYLKEAAGLMIFMLGAGAFTTLFEYPSSPVRMAVPSDLVRHVALGCVMGLVTAGIVYSPWGRKSGAHINPAVTWSFYRLGKIGGWDATLYTLFQFLGGMLAPLLLLWAIGDPFTHEKVKYATTQPGPEGAAIAFAAEFVISFILMLALLVATNSERWKGAAGAVAAALIALYIALESPLSGMSLNPARSFGSALAAGQWQGIWLYFVAPLTSMLLAAEVYSWMRRRRWIDRPDRLRQALEAHPSDLTRCASVTLLGDFLVQLSAETLGSISSGDFGCGPLGQGRSLPAQLVGSTQTIVHAALTSYWTRGGLRSCAGPPA